MAGGKESPRQKMINIMYLVLMAMLALNVSDTVLNAFRIIRESIVAARGNANDQLDLRFTAFDEALKNQPVRAEPLKAKADSVKMICDELYKYVDALKLKLVDPAEGIDPETRDFKQRSNLDIIPRVMINEGEAEKLKEKINDALNQLSEKIDEKDLGAVPITLDAEDFDKKTVPLGKSHKWTLVNFGEGTPLTAGYTILEKIQLDIINTQLAVTSYLLGKLSDVKLTLDTFDAVSIAPSSYILLGKPYTAEVFLTAYDSKQNPYIEVNGRQLPIKDGKGQYSFTPNREGVYKWRGKIRVKQTDGVIKEYETAEQVFQVAKPSAVVSADKMNVLYIGVDNPISVSAPGFAKEDLNVRVVNGRIKGGNGKYAVNVTKLGQASISVYSNDTNENLGSFIYRVKVIPDPVAKFAGVSGGSLANGVVKSQNRIFAIHENFDFDVTSSVKRFSMYLVRPRSTVQVFSTRGNRLSQEMLNAMARVTPGSRLIFDNIVAVKPGNIETTLNPIVISVN